MDIDNIINMLDGLVDNEVSRIKIKTDEDLPDNSIKREYHHGRCDIGSPWAKGLAFDVLEDEEN